MTKKPAPFTQQNSPLDMMNRLFAVVELIVQSDAYQKNRSQEQNNHGKTQN